MTCVAPAAELNRTVAADPITDIGVPKRAGLKSRPIPAEGDQLMTSHEMGLVDAALH